MLRSSKRFARAFDLAFMSGTGFSQAVAVTTDLLRPWASAQQVPPLRSLALRSGRGDRVFGGSQLAR